jgi:hypothetical protein
MAIFPWNGKYRGLTGLAAFFWLLVILIEEYSGQSISNIYFPLNSVILREINKMIRDKYSKKK